MTEEDRKQIEEIRSYLNWSGKSDDDDMPVSWVEILVARVDELQLKVKEAQEARAHMASCNLELMRKLDRAGRE